MCKTVIPKLWLPQTLNFFVPAKISSGPPTKNWYQIEKTKKNHKKSLKNKTLNSACRELENYNPHINTYNLSNFYRVLVSKFFCVAPARCPLQAENSNPYNSLSFRDIVLKFDESLWTDKSSSLKKFQDAGYFRLKAMTSGKTLETRSVTYLSFAKNF